MLIEHVWGSGEPVLLVHGGIASGELAWAAQRPLADRWRLRVVNRRGYHPNPADEGREDFEVDAADIAALLTEPTHLAGHSYGGVGALLAAAQRPGMVRSLTVSEPPAFAVAADHPAVADLTSRLQALWADGPDDPADFLRAFLATVGSSLALPDPLPPPLLQNVQRGQRSRGPWEAQIPLAALRGAAFPKLVVSGGHNPALDTVCDALAAGIGAQRAVMTGAGHSIPSTGGPYNEVLIGFLDSAER